MKKKSILTANRTIQVHSIVFGLTLLVPLFCWIAKILKPNQCFSLMGVGLFILSGHTMAYFDDYLKYLKKKETAEFFDEAGLKRFLRVGILIDLSLAFFFYTLGMK